MIPSQEDHRFVQRTTAAAIHISVLAAWVVLSARFIAPFFFLVIWAAILATALGPPGRSQQAGDRQASGHSGRLEHARAWSVGRSCGADA